MVVLILFSCQSDDASKTKADDNQSTLIYEKLISLFEGKKVKTLYHGYSQSGYHQINWNGNNDKGNSLSSGVYILSLEYDKNILNNKMVKIK